MEGHFKDFLVYCYFRVNGHNYTQDCSCEDDPSVNVILLVDPKGYTEKQKEI